MALEIEHACFVAEKGYEWIEAEDWNVLNGKRVRIPDAHKPKWRMRPPWNSPQTPRMLLRPVDPFALAVGGFSREGSGELGMEKPSLTGKDPVLFRKFAHVEPTTTAIVAFANQFGTLWDAEIGIPFGEWQYELGVLKFLIQVWDASGKSSTPWLRKQFPEKNGRLQCPYVDTVLRYADYQTGAVEIKKFSEAELPLQETAREYVVQAINLRLELAADSLELACSKAR